MTSTPLPSKSSDQMNDSKSKLCSVNSDGPSNDESRTTPCTYQSRDPSESMKKGEDDERSPPSPSQIGMNRSTLVHAIAKDDIPPAQATPTPMANLHIFLFFAFSLFFLRAYWTQRKELLHLKSQPMPQLTTYGNDVKYLLDELDEQETKRTQDLLQKSAQMDTLRKDNAYLHKKYNDLRKQHRAESDDMQERLRSIQDRFDRMSRYNEALEHKVLLLSRREQKIHLMELFLHLTQMDRKVCRTNAEVTEDEVMFLYSQLENAANATKSLRAKLQDADAHMDVLLKRSKRNIIGQQIYMLLKEKQGLSKLDYQ